MQKITIDETVVQERTKKLEKYLKFDPIDKIDKNLHDHVFGDFLTYKYPKRKIRAIVKTVKATLKLKQIIPYLNLTPARIQWYVG